MTRVRRSLRQGEVPPIVVPSSRTEFDDRTLVDQYQCDPKSEKGRRAASMLLSRYRKRVLIWCWRVIGDRELALDLSQEVLLNAYQCLENYNHDGRFGAWLFTIARNRCISELRRQRVPINDEAVLELVADARPGPDEEYERQVTEQELFRLIEETLTHIEQDVLWLRCYEGLSVELITSRLGIQEGTGARAVLQRARRKLRSALVKRKRLMPGVLE